MLSVSSMIAPAVVVERVVVQPVQRQEDRPRENRKPAEIDRAFKLRIDATEQVEILRSDENRNSLFASPPTPTPITGASPPLRSQLNRVAQRLSLTVCCSAAETPQGSTYLRFPRTSTSRWSRQDRSSPPSILVLDQLVRCASRSTASSSWRRRHTPCDRRNPPRHASM